ncbi:MAG: VWA domain-containing protein [Bacteroidetes bacterium]|nr:VWA domain-containing protein [Bacteroidota bacterium]
MKEFRIAHEVWIYAYLAIPVMIVLFLLFYQWRKNALRRFGERQVIQPLFATVSNAKLISKFVLITIAMLFIITAIIGPQLGSKLEEVKRKGVDLVVCLDVSNSMNAEDLKPSRIERSKQALFRLIDKLDGDRLGIIVFAGQSYTQLPITTDYGAAKLMVSTINTDMVPTQGTAIGSAIELAVQSFGDSIRRHNAAIVVITDGENHEDDAIEAAKEAAEKGIVVHTIGMGSASGAPIPIMQYGQRVGFMQDESGQTIMTKLDENNLMQIADAGKGKFIRASTSDDGLAIVFKELSKLTDREFSSQLFTDYEDQFQWFLGLGLLFLILEFILSETKSKWIESLNLFGDKKTSVK